MGTTVFVVILAVLAFGAGIYGIWYENHSDSSDDNNKKHEN